MSKVNLTTLLFYRGDSNHCPIDKELPLEGMEKLFRGIQFPSRGMTFLYGHRNPAPPYFMQQAAAIGLDVALVDVHVEIGKWLRHQVDLSDQDDRGLRFTRFLNVARATKDVTDRLQGVWVKQLGGERAGQEGWPKGATRYPYLLDQVMELPEFAHLAVIAYNIQTAELGSVKVATLFDDTAIEVVDGGSKLAHTDIVLP